MNFLAHLYLSGNDEEIIIGNFIADMVKGLQINGYSPGIVKGIRLHRKIDEFTDSHHIVKKSKSRLRGRYRHYSGVVVDMYYDHFLAKNWTDYSGHKLDDYVERAYGILDDNHDILPGRVQYILPFMIEHNWLVNYADPGKLSMNFGGMARRTPFESGMETAVDELLDYYEEFGAEFSSFFPELVRYVEKQGVSHHHHGPPVSSLLSDTSQ